MNTDDTQAMKVSFDGTAMSLTTTSGSHTLGSVSDFYHYTEPYYPTRIWPSYTLSNTVYRESKIDTAFKIVEKLMDKGHIKELTVKEFTKLVKEIADTL